MILVTVGTEQYPFNALMDWVNLLIRNGFIDQNEEVVVQYGCSTKLPDQVKVFKLLPESAFKTLVDQARLIIAHCGEGTALLLEASGKPYVLVPRTQRFGEHVDDHQLELADALEQQGVSIARSPASLTKFLTATESTDLKLPQADLCKQLSEYYGDSTDKKIMLVCSSGGHFKEMQQLKPFRQQFQSSCWVTFRAETTKNELQDEPGRVYWAHSPTNRNLPNLVRNLFLAFKVLQREQPNLVLSTGAGVAVPFLLLAKLLCRSQVIFVESRTRIKQLSLSARILRAFAVLDQLFVHSPELAKRYPKVQCARSTEVDSVIRQDSASKSETTVFQHQGTTVLSTPARLTTVEVLQFRAVLKGLDQSFSQKIVLDMSATKFIDSTGLGALVACLKLAQAGKHELVLWSVIPEVRATLVMVGIDRAFNIEEAAATARTYRDKDLKRQLRQDPQLKLHPSVNHPIKRSIDIVGAVVGLSIMAILLIPISIAIQLDDPGPIFFSQVRCGLMSKRFRIWKFRSMVANAEALKSQIANQANGNFFKNDKDPRITRVGRFLRKTSLDEFPQFWNVLLGDMSLVGTRPPTAEELNHYDAPEWARLDVKPGITGEWQVNGRSKIRNFEDVIKLDLKYQKNWSLKRDLSLLLKTVTVLFSKDSGAI
ncbi:sugar transferase [Leptolyngbya sp. FACHB-261]|uniref:sugar transferase n=1 Tax=Leptolyngbya sp. FACHB-261 TaxID=2692806 RepID=UPI00168347E3|nr:sugar transferase [Leptolyngbya sp. FACHB-261]MBD2105159.1 sugar transferase [Leptolyngbya sp. FACHB-261]